MSNKRPNSDHIARERERRKKQQNQARSPKRADEPQPGTDSTAGTNADLLGADSPQSSYSLDGAIPGDAGVSIPLQGATDYKVSSGTYFDLNRRALSGEMKAYVTEKVDAVRGEFSGINDKVASNKVSTIGWSIATIITVAAMVWGLSERGISKVEDKVERLEEKADSLDRRSERVGNRVNSVEVQIDSLRARLESLPAHNNPDSTFGQKSTAR